MAGLLVAGIAAILAGVAAIVFGVPVKEFSFGNTLILTGTIGTCTGLLLVGMALMVRDMRKLSERVSVAAQPSSAGDTTKSLAPPKLMERNGADAAPSAIRPLAPQSGLPPWQDELQRDKERERARAASAQPEQEPTPDEQPAEPVRRNLLFATSKRERAAARVDGPATAALANKRAASVLAEGDVTKFVENWPLDRPDANRPASNKLTPVKPRPVETTQELESSEAEDEPITVLKSGVVDGMAYSLYSDGSIEAQLPEGMMRFASIDELREHLDRRES